MKRICPHVSDCVCDESGVLNISAEDPDPLIFTGIGYTPSTNYRPPDLGDVSSLASAQDCYGVAYSVASQEIADLIAQINAIACVETGGGSGGAPVGNTGHPTGLGGGGGGGGGGGQRRRDRSTPGSRGTDVPGLNPWGCREIDLDPTKWMYTLTTANPGSVYIWSVTSGSLPDGVELKQVSMNSASLQGTPTDFNDYGPYPFTATVELANTTPGTRFIVEEIDDVFEIVGISNADSAPVVPRGTDYTFQLEAYGTSPITYKLIDGSLPNGIQLSDTGLLTGQATNAECGQTFYPKIQTTDAKGRVCWEIVPLTVQGLIFTNANPPDGTLCVAYNFTFTTDPAGATFSGTVPDGLTLNPATGEVTGTPVSEDGTFNIHAEVNENCTGDYNAYIFIDNTGSCAQAAKDLVWTEYYTGVPHGTPSGSNNNVKIKCDCGGCTVKTAQFAGLYADFKNQCVASYDLTFTINWSYDDIVCAGAHTAGSIRLYQKIDGPGAVPTLEQYFLVGSGGPASGSISATVTVPAPLACWGAGFSQRIYFVVLVSAGGGGGSIEASLTITPDAPP